MSLQQIINQNSYIVAAGFIVLIALFGVIAKFRRLPLAWAGLGVLIVALVAINMILRVDVHEIETTAQFDQILASRQPVVLEIYSNY